MQHPKSEKNVSKVIRALVGRALVIKALVGRASRRNSSEDQGAENQEETYRFFALFGDSLGQAGQEHRLFELGLNLVTTACAFKFNASLTLHLPNILSTQISVEVLDSLRRTGQEAKSFT